MKNLNDLGVQELSDREIKETEGGIAICLALGLIALTIAAYNSADLMAEAAIEAYNDSNC